MAVGRGRAGSGGELDEALVRAGRYLRKGMVSADLRTMQKTGGRDADSFYRDRWSYTYSPTRVRYPYVRSVLRELFREAKARRGSDPVLAWAEITGDPGLAGRYKSARGNAGFVRASWEKALEIAAAAHVHTIRTWDPDRIAGFSPIPAMSMVSHAAGARFHALIGGADAVVLRLVRRPAGCLSAGLR